MGVVSLEGRNEEARYFLGYGINFKNAARDLNHQEREQIS